MCLLLKIYHKINYFDIKENLIIFAQDVGDLFRSGELENSFSNIIEALYEGKRFVSQNAILNKVRFSIEELSLPLFSLK